MFSGGVALKKRREDYYVFNADKMSWDKLKKQNEKC